MNFIIKKKEFLKSRLLLFLIFGIISHTLFFTILHILKYKSFFAFDWEDLAVYNQICWNTAHGKLFYSGIFNTIFFQHMQLILAVVSLFYLVYPHICSLFFAQSLFLAIGAIPIYLIFRKDLDSALLGVLAGFSYLFFPPLNYLGFVDFRPSILSVPFILFAFYFFKTGKFTGFAVASIFAISCKENISLIIAMFGILSLIQKKHKKWAIFSFSSLIWFILSLEILLPRLGYSKALQCDDFSGGEGEAGIFGILLFIINNPMQAARIIFTEEHLSFLLRLFNPPIFLLAIFRPMIIILALPTFLEVFLQKGILTQNEAHHISGIVIFIFLAAFSSIKMISKRISMMLKAPFWAENRMTRYLVVIFLILSFFSNFGNNIICANLNYETRHEIDDTRFLSCKNIYDKKYYIQDQDDLIAWKLINLIPSKSSVSASADLLPALSNRSQIYEFGIKHGEDLQTDYILLHTKNICNGASSSEIDNTESAKRIPEIVSSGSYELLSLGGDFLLFKKYDYSRLTN